MTSEEIRAQFPAWVPVLFADKTYAKPTVAWLRDRFYPWFQKQRFDLGLHRATRKNDCDNFSRAYVQAAQDCHALTVGEDSEGLAVGEFWYIGQTHVQGPHSIAVAFTDEGKVYFEPQNGQRLALKPLEELSAYGVHF